MCVPYKEIDGCESQFFCNHISHFLFINLILSHISSPGECIINTTSCMAGWCTINSKHMDNQRWRIPCLG
ncbi:hypothetical protein BDQ17DRAFT_1361236 [Cyathus striatus]|nr:hypothetical protein BDQ17DRAFT_1361236 [Cyathus striatus]